MAEYDMRSDLNTPRSERRRCTDTCRVKADLAKSFAMLLPGTEICWVDGGAGNWPHTIYFNNYHSILGVAALVMRDFVERNRADPSLDQIYTYFHKDKLQYKFGRKSAIVNKKTWSDVKEGMAVTFANRTWRITATTIHTGYGFIEFSAYPEAPATHVQDIRVRARADEEVVENPDGSFAIE